MLSQKQLAQAREQMRREIADLDHQIHQLQTFYLQDTKEVGNLLKGFQTYVPNKTSKIQSGSKRPRAQNYQRLFSLSSISSNTSRALQESLNAQPIIKSDPARDKRNRFRGKPKSGGKTVMKEDGQDDDDMESGEAQDEEDSGDESASKNRNNSKKKKPISKIPARKG